MKQNPQCLNLKFKIQLDLRVIKLVMNKGLQLQKLTHSRGQQQCKREKEKKQVSCFGEEKNRHVLRLDLKDSRDYFFGRERLKDTIFCCRGAKDGKGWTNSGKPCSFVGKI